MSGEEEKDDDVPTAEEAAVESKDTKECEAESKGERCEGEEESAAAAAECTATPRPVCASTAAGGEREAEAKTAVREGEKLPECGAPAPPDPATAAGGVTAAGWWGS